MNFFQLENIGQLCVRTVWSKLQGATEPRNGIIMSEGCFRMKIYNDSATDNLTIKIKGIERTILRGTSYEFPGFPYLVRSDEISYEWSGILPANYNALIERDIVDKFLENVDYPAQREN